MSGGARGRRSDLIGRQRELDRIQGLIDGLREGRGSALRIEGEPGVGKSALLEALVPEDLTTLRATGVEVELELPLAGLEELMSGLPGGWERIGDGSDPAELLRDAASRIEKSAPLLVLVDDMQWLDPSSRGAITYLARRAPQLGIGLIGVWSLRGTRPDDWPGVEILRLSELEPAEAFELARQQGLAEPVAESLVAAVGGNPLALIEGPADMASAQRRGQSTLPEPVPVGESLRVAYAARIATLDEEVGEALLLAAAGAPAEMVADRLGPAEDLGLVRLGAGYEFTHPLIRSAVYHSAIPSKRREAHRSIATGVSDPEKTRQLALAAEGPDEELAERLAGLADDAMKAGAPGTAASMWGRSVELSVDPERKRWRALQGARTALVAGRPAAAIGLLGITGDSLAGPELQLLRGAAIYMAGRPREAQALLEAEAGKLEGSDPSAASVLLVQACVTLMGSGPMTELRAMAERALELAPRNAEAMPAVTLAAAEAVLNRPDQARQLLDQHQGALAGWDPTGPGHEVLAMVGFCLLWLGELDQAEEWLKGLVEADRAAGADSVLAAPLGILAGVQARAGRLREATEAAREATEIADTGLDVFSLTLVLSASALVAAARGDEETCRAAAARISELGKASDLASSVAAAEQALGAIELSKGNGDAASEHLRRAAEQLELHGTANPSFMLTDADLVEALMRVGRRAEAEEAFDRLLERAEATGDRWARSAVERCRGLLGPADEIESRLHRSLEILGDEYMLPEAARTRLVLGERLRRERRRSAARRELGLAQDGFERIGARLWADRAARELAAAEGSAGNDLTARERDVCELVASGSTNREVAEALFLSTRTVEHHLRSAYRKLGVRSRSELAASWRG